VEEEDGGFRRCREQVDKSFRSAVVGAITAGDVATLEKALADKPQQLRAWALLVGFPLRESLGREVDVGPGSQSDRAQCCGRLWLRLLLRVLGRED
jgi:hypothetical protein